MGALMYEMYTRLPLIDAANLALNPNIVNIHGIIFIPLQSICRK